MDEPDSKPETDARANLAYSIAEASARRTITAYQEKISAIAARHGDLVDALGSRLDKADAAGNRDTVDAVDDFAAELKSLLGASAANRLTDAQMQEEAIGICEAWVTDNVSNAPGRERVLCAFEALGAEDGEAFLGRIFDAPSSPEP